MGELFEQRKQNLYDAIAFKEPAKVPVGVQMMNWAFTYAGTTYGEVMGDVEKTTKACTKHMYDFDYDYAHCSISAAVDVYQALGSEYYILGPDGNTVEHNQTKVQFMTLEDYDLLIKDPGTFMSETLPKRLGATYHLPFGEAYEKFKNAARAALKFAEVTKNISDVCKEREFIVPFMGSPTPRFMSSFNQIFDKLRGIQNALTDARRHTELVYAACEALDQLTINSDPNFKNPKDHYDAYPLARATNHSECFINPKQFQKFFMEPFQKYYLQFVERGGRYYMRGEGQFKWNIEVMRDLPKGTITVMLDMDDPFETYPIMKDQIPIGTGINLNLLQFGTPDQCRDYVKKCFDTFAPGGGFVFAQSAGLLSAKDARVENFIATFDEAHKQSYKK